MSLIVESWHFYLGTKAKSILSIHVSHEETPDNIRLQGDTFGHNILILGNGNINKAPLCQKSQFNAYLQGTHQDYLFCICWKKDYLGENAFYFQES